MGPSEYSLCMIIVITESGGMRNIRITAVALSALAVFGMSSGAAQAATTLDQAYETANIWYAIPTNGLAHVVTAGLTGP